MEIDKQLQNYATFSRGNEAVRGAILSSGTKYLNCLAESICRMYGHTEKARFSKESGELHFLSAKLVPVFIQDFAVDSYVFKKIVSKIWSCVD